MSQNQSITQLDASQIVKRVYDQTSDSVRVNLGDASGLAVNLSATLGDSIVTYDRSLSQKASITSANTGTIVGPFDVSGMPNINLFTNTTATITGAQLCTLQVSPSDTDNVWINTSTTITPSTTNATVVMGTAAQNIIARRARIIIAAAVTSGTFDIYAVAQGN